MGNNDSRSDHLDEILTRHNRTCSALVTFVDVEAYSKRRTANQIEVIDALSSAVTSSLDEVARQYLKYAQNNGLNFQTDVIKIPTGDGVAVVFSFDGLPSIHLDYALALLRSANADRAEPSCLHFTKNGWCNCHKYFNLRIGLAEGKLIVYKDVNGNYNVAGNAINLASRAMGLADRNQIIFTESAHNQIVDMIDDATFINRFREFRDVTIKHKEQITVYQYCSDHSFLNSDPPKDLILKQKMETAMKSMGTLGFPMGSPKKLEQLDTEAMANFVESFADLVTKASENFQNLSGAPVALVDKGPKSER